MRLFRKIAALGAALAAARRYARSNPDKVNRYADKAAAFVDGKTQGKYRRHIDSALGQVRKETGHGRGVHGGHPYGNHQYGDQSYGSRPYDGPTQSYPSWREDRPRH